MWHADRLPPWFTVTSLVVLCVITALRWALVRETPIDRRINEIALFATISSLLREPAIATWIAPVIPGGTLVINDLWHFIFLLTCTGVVGLFLLQRPDLTLKQARSQYRIWLAVSAVIGVMFLVLSYPARSKGLLLQDDPSWRYGAYFFLYCLIPVATCIYGVKLFLSLRSRAGTRREQAVLAVLLLVAVGGAINMSVLFIGAAVASAGVDDAFTRETEIRAGGELILPFVVLIMLVAVPSVVRAVAELLRVDANSTRGRELRPVWQDLTKATPEVILRMSLRDRLGSTSAERLHRMEREVHDSVAIVSRYADCLDPERDALIEDSVSEELEEQVRSAAELLMAARSIAAAGGARAAGAPPHALGRSANLDELIQVWDEARRIADAAVDEDSVGLTQ